ncbi:MAG: 3-hydroxyacyl-CoA dehydrogenase family protein [Acidobacteriota bacterium]
MTEKIVAVVGAGVMGCDLALDLAGHDFSVIIKDLTPEILGKAEENIKTHYKAYRLMKKDVFSRSGEDLLAKIRFVYDYQGFESADMVIENITEEFEAKAEVYRELSRVCQDQVLFGVNTSCISITKISSLVPRPENVIGMHFFNPVPLKDLVELIPGWKTSDETLKRAKNFLKSLGKTWVVVQDLPGFATNRVLMLMINESIWLLHDKVSEPEVIDTIFKTGFGHKMGPLATADLIGLDTVLNSLLVLFQSYGDPKYRPCPSLVKMVEAGRLGKKSGQGFFKYQRS